MYKVEDKLKCIHSISGNYNFSSGLIYEIAMKRINEDAFMMVDDNKKVAEFSKSELNFGFELIDKETLFIQECTNLKTLKNTKASHYNLWLDTDSIDIIKSNLTQEEYIGALKFNILKYQLRLGKKDCIESDMEKIEDYKRELNDILGAK